MKRIVVTEQEACSIPEIIELYELTEQEKENCKIRDIFNTDPDYFSWGIKNHIHKIPLVEVLDKYIIVPDDDVIGVISDYKIKKLSEKCKNMLVTFFEDNFKEYFISRESTWVNFDALNFGIAYRGGSGYSYSIWMYKPSTKK